MTDQETLNKVRIVAVGIVLGCVGAFSGSVLSVENEDLKKENLLVWREDVKPWYKNLFYFTAWPKEEGRTDLKERLDIPYSFERLITEVMKDGVLEKGWSERVLRVKDWLQNGSNDRRLDAYLYRQNFNGGILHICDTRPAMAVALTFEKDKDPLRDPNETLRTIKEKLFKAPYTNVDTSEPIYFDPNKIKWNTKSPSVRKRLEDPDFLKSLQGPIFYPSRLKQDPDTGMFLATSISWSGEREINAKKETRVAMYDRLGETVAVFEFGKRYVDGCELDSRFPIFGEAPPEFLAAERAKGKIESFADPNSADIPALIKLLVELPEGPTHKQYEENPYLFWSLTSAKCTVVILITEAVESIETGGDDEIALIRMTLQAESYFPEPNDNPAQSRLRKLTEAAVDALNRIGTDEAAKLHFDIAEREKGRVYRFRYMKGLGNYRIFRKRFEKLEEEGKLSGDDGKRMPYNERFEVLRKEWRATVPSSLGQMKQPKQMEQPSEQLENEDPNVPASKGPNGAARKYMGIILAGVLLIVGLLLLQKKKASSHSK